MTPTTMQLIDQADSNSNLDERSLKSSCQLPVDTLHKNRQVIKVATPNTTTQRKFSCTRQGKRLTVVCLFVLFCTSTCFSWLGWVGKNSGLRTKDPGPGDPRKSNSSCPTLLATFYASQYSILVIGTSASSLAWPSPSRHLARCLHRLEISYKLF